MELVELIFKIPNVEVFLSERLCQDPLEKFFGCQRQRGKSHENPNMQQFCSGTQALRVVNGTCGSVSRGNCRGNKSIIDWKKESQPLSKRKRIRARSTQATKLTDFNECSQSDDERENEEQTVQIKQRNKPANQSKKVNEEEDKPPEQSMKVNEEGDKPAAQNKKVNEEEDKPPEQSKNVNEEGDKPAEQSKKANDKGDKPAEQSKKVNEEEDKPPEQSKNVTEEGDKPAAQSKKVNEEGDKPAAQSKKANDKGDKPAEQSKKVNVEGNKLAEQSKKVNEEGDKPAEQRKKANVERYMQSKEFTEPLVTSFIYSCFEDEIIEKAVGPGSNEDLIVSGFNISLKWCDFKLLRETHWLNDKVAIYNVW